MRQFDLDVVATRGDLVESRHLVHAAVVDARGTACAAARDPAIVTIWRSCAKPFQVMPFVESGAIDALGWGEEELAIACGSHGGEPEHVALVETMLGAIGREEGDLVCGAHEPLSHRGLRLLQQSGARLTRLYNNCSGKHAALLAYARSEGWPALGYENAAHPAQRRALACVSHWSGVPETAVHQSVDGCGVVAFGLPLESLARAFAALGAAAARREEVPLRIAAAMGARPFFVAGTDRLDTVLMQETAGRVVSKVGAEGVHAAVALDAGIAVAVKVADGAQRAQHAALLRLLQHLGVLSDPLPPRLAPFMHMPILNTRGETVGEIRPAA